MAIYSIQRVVRLLITSLLQIYQGIFLWKVIVNRLRSDRIMVMSLWPHFLAHPVRFSKPTRRLALIETLRYRIYTVDPETTRSSEFCHCRNVYLRTLSAWVSTLVNYRARASEEGNDIGRVRPSVSLFFRPLFFHSNLWTAWPLTPWLFHVYGLRPVTI